MLTLMLKSTIWGTWLGRPQLEILHFQPSPMRGRDCLEKTSRERFGTFREHLCGAANSIKDMSTFSSGVV